MTDRELMQQALDALTVYDGTNGVSKRKRVLAALRERLAQPEQEPFCYHDGRNIVGKEFADHSDVFPLYVAPCEWQELTKDDVDGWQLPEQPTVFEFAQFVEEKLKEKNNT